MKVLEECDVPTFKADASLPKNGSICSDETMAFLARLLAI
jgi:hypothetical protein